MQLSSYWEIPVSYTCYSLQTPFSQPGKSDRHYKHKTWSSFSSWYEEILQRLYIPILFKKSFPEEEVSLGFHSIYLHWHDSNVGIIWIFLGSSIELCVCVCVLACVCVYVCVCVYMCFFFYSFWFWKGNHLFLEMILRSVLGGL